MPNLPPPPVPQKPCEMLKNYPKHLQKLPKALNGIFADPPKATPPFEMAVWVLKDTLGDFLVKAGVELRAAEASDDAQAIAAAKGKRSVIGTARANMGGLSDLMTYFDSHKEAFE